MTNRQLDEIIELICSYCVTTEDIDRVIDNCNILIENMEEEEENE